MSKLTGTEICEVLKESRRKDYMYEESWKDLETIGLSHEYLDKLGEIQIVSRSNDEDYFYEAEIVWHFVDHDVYIKAKVYTGSYGTGYKLETWDLKEVFPKKVEITVYE